jgi:hypothetical protein
LDEAFSPYTPTALTKRQIANRIIKRLLIIEHLLKRVLVFSPRLRMA